MAPPHTPVFRCVQLVAAVAPDLLQPTLVPHLFTGKFTQVMSSEATNKTFVILSLAELMFSWFCRTLSSSGVTPTLVAFTVFCLYRTWRDDRSIKNSSSVSCLLRPGSLSVKPQQQRHTDWTRPDCGSVAVTTPNPNPAPTNKHM